MTPEVVSVSGRFRKVIVGGVVVYVRDEYPAGHLESVVAGLVAAERERAAKVADDVEAKFRQLGAARAPLDRMNTAAGAAKTIAKRIREGSP